MTASEHFQHLVESELKRDHVELGKMMSSPGLKYKQKVYAFLYKDTVGFKLGKEFAIDQYNLSSWEYLSPFKTKAPLTAWYMIHFDNQHVWDEFVKLAFDYIRLEVNKK